MKKFNSDTMALLKDFWKDVHVANTKYHKDIGFIEEQLKHHTGIDIEVFHIGGEPVGYGDYNREYKLYQIEEDE